MENTFWMATILYYVNLFHAVTHDAAYIIVTAIMFLIIPSTTEVRLMPGMKQTLQSNIEILKTQLYLNRTGYYE